MNALLFRCSLALTVVVSSGTVSVARIAQSSYCVAITVQAEEKDILAERFDEFARAAGLFIDRSHPTMRVYTPEDVASPVDSSAMIILQKMGPLGSILTYSSLRAAPSAELVDELKRFVAGPVSQVYPTTPCDQVEGFTPPVLSY
jgi:hypothetical protein